MDDKLSPSRRGESHVTIRGQSHRGLRAVRTDRLLDSGPGRVSHVPAARLRRAARQRLEHGAHQSGPLHCTATSLVLVTAIPSITDRK